MSILRDTIVEAARTKHLKAVMALFSNGPDSISARGELAATTLDEVIDTSARVALQMARERTGNMRPRGSSPDGYVINDTLNRVQGILDDLLADLPEQKA